MARAQNVPRELRHSDAVMRSMEVMYLGSGVRPLGRHRTLVRCLGCSDPGAFILDIDIGQRTMPRDRGSRKAVTFPQKYMHGHDPGRMM